MYRGHIYVSRREIEDSQSKLCVSGLTYNFSVVLHALKNEKLYKVEARPYKKN